MTNLEIIQTIIELLKQDPSSDLLIWYGAKGQNSHDIDLVATFEDPLLEGNYILGKIDLLCIDKNRFRTLLLKFDPIAVEPAFTGEVMYGNAADLENFKRRVKAISPGQEIISHLIQTSVRQYLDAVAFLNDYKEQKRFPLLLWALINLSFSCSYYFFAQVYSRNPKKGPLTLKELLKNPQVNFLREVQEQVKSAKRNPDSLSQGIVAQLLYQWESKLIA